VPGGILSVALSFTLPRLRVTEHPALWCSDFPPDLKNRPGDRLDYSDRISNSDSSCLTHDRRLTRRLGWGTKPGLFKKWTLSFVKKCWVSSLNPAYISAL